MLSSNTRLGGTSPLTFLIFPSIEMESNLKRLQKQLLNTTRVHLCKVTFDNIQECLFLLEQQTVR